MRVLSAALLSLLCVFVSYSTEQDAPAEAVQGVYSINADVETTNFWNSEETWFGRGHAFALKEAPGYAITCAHVVIGRVEEPAASSDFSGVLTKGETLNLRSKKRHLRLIDTMLIDLEPGKGKHLQAVPVLADIYSDLALLRIEKGKPEYEFTLANRFTPWMDRDCSVIAGEKGSDPILRKAGKMHSIVRWTGWHVFYSERDRHYVFHDERARHGNSGAPVLQNGEVVSIVQRGAEGVDACGMGPLGIRRFLRRAFEELGEKELLANVLKFPNVAASE